MNELQVRIPSGISQSLLREIRREAHRESVVFAFASHARTSSRDLILVREIVVPPESAFLPPRGHGARWSGAYMVGLLNRALETNLGLFIFHAHDGDDVRMSSDDLRSAHDLLPRFQSIVPNRPHGSIVFGNYSVDGMVQMPYARNTTDRLTVRLLERNSVRTFPLPNIGEDRQLLLRQPLTVSALLRTILRRLVVAVVGASGGGSQVIPQLAALGVGEIICIDDQRADQSNRLASPNLGWIDAALGLSKVTAAKYRAWLVNREVRISAIRARIPEQKALDALKRADLVIGCVNNLHARADINEVAWRYCIPYIDVGLRMVTDSSPAAQEPRPVVQYPGNLCVSIPGEPCLWCSGFLSDTRLLQESNGQGRSYLQDPGGSDVFVTCFNGTLASEAVAEALRLVTGLDCRREFRRQYDGFEGSLLQMSVAKDEACRLCSSGLATGDPNWARLDPEPSIP